MQPGFANKILNPGPLAGNIVGEKAKKSVGIELV